MKRNKPGISSLLKESKKTSSPKDDLLSSGPSVFYGLAHLLDWITARGSWNSVVSLGC